MDVSAKERLAAGLWGAAEASFFFVVPDVLLTFVAQRRGLRAAWIAGAFAALAAALGALPVHRLGASDPGRVDALLDALPAISTEMIATARADMERDGAVAVVRGAFSGVPFKVYAAGASRAGIDLAAFLALTPPVRWLRFAASTTLAAFVTRRVLRRASERVRAGVLAAFWILFYAAYLGWMPS